MKKYVTRICVILTMASFNSIADVNRSKLEQMLLMDASNDVIDEMPNVAPQFSERFPNLERNDVISNLNAIVRDYSASEIISNLDHRLIYDQAILGLETYAPTESRNTLWTAFTNADDRIAKVTAAACVKATGLGHDSFEVYYSLVANTNIFSREKISGIMYGIYQSAHGNDVSSRVTNRVCWLCLEVENKRLLCLDSMLCRFWDGYRASSNRLESTCREIDRNSATPVARNYYISVTNELISLPPGTLQLLPTNQFYNVED